MHGPHRVAGRAEGTQRGHHREPRADGSLVKPMSAAVRRRLREFLEACEVAGVGLLVRGHHVDPRAEPVAVFTCDKLGGCVVDDHRGAAGGGGVGF